jgi:cytochrome c
MRKACLFGIGRRKSVADAPRSRQARGPSRGSANAGMLRFTLSLSGQHLLGQPRLMTPQTTAANAALAALLGFLLAVLLVPALAQQGNADEGAEVFKKCRACHDIGAGAKNKVGPLLNGVIGRKAGTIEGFNYSTSNKSAGDKGLIWTPDVLFKYLENPLTFMPGTKMVFLGLK